MDNANEIVRSAHKEVSLFLGDELKSREKEAAVTYDLIKEYAKTARHKNKFVWILLVLCFFVVGAGTALTIGAVTNSNHKIAINIDSFDDLNLKALLGSASRTQALYDSAVKTKRTLEQNLESELSQAEQKRRMDLFTLESVSTVATRQSILERRNEIDREYNATVKSLRETYGKEIARADEEIKKYQSQADSYDAAALSKARNAEASIDSTKQLHDIEMKNQEERYERQIQILRNRLLEQQIKAAEEQRRAVEDVRNIYQAKIDLLDPKAREQNNEQDKIIFEAGIEKQTDNSQLWESVDQLSFNGSDYTNSSSDPKFSETISEAQKELEELRTIAGRFRPIPLENSIKDYVPAIMHQSYRIANSLAENAAKMQNDLAAFHTIAERSLLNNADGIILSTENAPVFSVYIANMSRARIEGKESVPAQILNGNRQAATGILSIQDGYFIVTQEIDENTPPAKIYNPNPGDRIRIIP